MPVLRLILACLLVSAAALAFSPTASACTADLGPVGSVVCVTDFNHEFGDPTCEDPGYHYGSTYGYADLAGAAHASAAGDHSCLNNGGHQRETQQVRATVAVWGVTVVNAEFTDSQQSDGDFCHARVQGHTAPSGSVEQILPCPVGGLPILPWGDLLP